MWLLLACPVLDAYGVSPHLLSTADSVKGFDWACLRQVLLLGAGTCYVLQGTLRLGCASHE